MKGLLCLFSHTQLLSRRSVKLFWFSNHFYPVCVSILQCLTMRLFHDLRWPVLGVYVTPERVCDGVAADWPRQITWPTHWPLIGRDTSCVSVSGSDESSALARRVGTLSSQLLAACPALSTSPLSQSSLSFLTSSWLNKGDIKQENIHYWQQQ